MIRKALLWTVFGFLSLFVGSLSLQTYAQFGNTDYVEDIGVPGTQDGLQGSKLLDIIKNFINWMLGMLATVALVLCLYAGFLMTTAAGDDGKYKKGMKILQQAGVGLVIIGLAWAIVSLIFWLIWAFT